MIITLRSLILLFFRYSCPFPFSSSLLYRNTYSDIVYISSHSLGGDCSAVDVWSVFRFSIFGDNGCSYCIFMIVVAIFDFLCLLRPGRWTKYCDQRVCMSVCLSVCLSVCSHNISKIVRPNLTKFFVHVTCSRRARLVLLWRQCYSVTWITRYGRSQQTSLPVPPQTIITYFRYCG